MAPTTPIPRRSSGRGVQAQARSTRASNRLTEQFTAAASPGLTAEEIFQLIAAGGAIPPASTADAPTASSTPTPPAAPAMAPVRDPHDVDAQIRDVHQTLYDIQNITHGYQGAETADVLVERFSELETSLRSLRSLALSPRASTAGVELPPEILDYVDGGRNPDIFSREFIEIVLRGNWVVNGKKEAFKSFSEILAEELRKSKAQGGMGGMNKQVDRIVAAAEERRRRAAEMDREGKGHANGQAAANGNGNGGGSTA